MFAIEQVHPIKVARFPSFTDGIVFDSAGYAYVSHGRLISRVAPDGTNSVWAETGGPHGHKILPDSTHLVCDGSHRAVLHLDWQGKILGSAASDCDGQPLRDPNDLTLDPKGGFYFTDTGGTREQRIGSVCFADRQGHTHTAARGLHYPNGIVLRPDGKLLYVSESLRNRIVTFDVLAPGKLGPMKVFANLPAKQDGQMDNEPDGLCLDQHGNLYVAHYGMGMVEVLGRKGRLIRQYPAGMQTVSNLAFGGAKTDQLYLTGGLGAEGHSEGGLFRLELRGARGFPPITRRTP